MSTITASTTHTPNVIVGFSSDRTARNIEHQTLGGTISITLRKATARSGSIRAIFATEEAARALEMELALPLVFTLTRDDLADAPMQFVPNGRISVLLDTAAYTWSVDIDFREVTS